MGTKGSIEASREGLEAEIGQSLESRDRMGWEKMLNRVDLLVKSQNIRMGYIALGAQRSGKTNYQETKDIRLIANSDIYQRSACVCLLVCHNFFSHICKTAEMIYT